MINIVNVDLHAVGHLTLKSRNHEIIESLNATINVMSFILSDDELYCNVNVVMHFNNDR